MRILLAFLILFTSSCHDHTPKSLVNTLDRKVATHPNDESEVDPQDIPSDFRRLDLSPIPAAVETLRMVKTNPFDQKLRSELVEIYKCNGFMGASFFFQNTLRDLKNEPAFFYPVKNPIAWAASERDISGEASQAASEVARLVGRGDFDSALRFAKNDIEANGLSLHTVVQWADTVIWLSTVEPDRVSSETLEVAVRVFLTSLLEKTPRAIGIDSPATGFEKLSNMFIRVGDDVSALTAARLALHYLQQRESDLNASRDDWTEISTNRLTERIRTLMNSR